MSGWSGTWKGRILAVLLLCGVIIALASLTLAPLRAVNARYQNEITDLQARLTALHRSAAMGAQLGPQLERLERVQTSDVHYLRSSSEALAAAEMQALVKQIILPKGGQILSTQQVPSEQDRFFTRVALKVRMKANLDTLVGIFYEMETRSPYLFVNNLTIRGQSLPRRFTRNRNQSGAWPAMDVDFELVAYMKEQQS